jgi:hypothetical protein
VRIKTEWRIITKALNVIKSCNTIEQLINAVEYARLAHLHHCDADDSHTAYTHISLATERQAKLIRNGCRKPDPVLKGNEDAIIEIE